MPDEVLLTPYTEIGVSGILKKRLTIGVALLRNLTVDEFKAVIAHEFGHFYGKDTVVGGILWRIGWIMERVSKFGKVWWEAFPFTNIAAVGGIIMIFYWLYRLFYSIAVLAYMRMFEYRADFVASVVAGKENFCNGLLNYAAFGVFFDTVCYTSIIRLLAQRKMFVNVYEAIHNAYLKANTNKIKRMVIEKEKASIFSTHPPLRKRLARFGKAQAARRGKPAMTLFKDYRTLERGMTQILTNVIRARLAYAAPAAGPA
ncbi:MAG: M48 family metallopeptidase [Candidatus Aenigmatarchaeota archaeon]